MNKCVIFLADGFEEIEAISVIDILRRGGVEVAALSVGTDISVTGAHGIRIAADSLWDSAIVNGAHMLIIPGGMRGTVALRSDSRILQALREADSSGRFVAAICAGPTTLARAGILEGKTVTCYPGLEGELTAVGARYASDRHVVRDGAIITARGPASAMAFALELLAALTDSACAKECASGLLFD